MGSPAKRRCGGCPHLAELWGSRRALSQLQRSLLAHFQERKAADEPLMPLGDGAMCLACSIRAESPQAHPEAGRLGCPGPPVLLDLRTGELYCTACADYVFDRGFDLALQTAMAAAKNGGSRGASGASGADASGSDATAAAAAAPPEGAPQRGGAPPELQAAAELSRALAEGGFRPLAADGFPAGLRGLNNLGNTCFMNSVLQAILHAPLLRNHYLLNRHSKAGCSITADGGYCVNCELDGVFSASYSGRRSGYSPAQFLHTWWMLAGGGLAGYQQQDAHEFFCFVLEMMAATAGPDNITQRVFGGTLRSDLVCACCGHISTSHEQFSHLSLDIPPPQQLIAPTILPRPTGGGGSQATAAAAAAAAAAPAAAAAAAAAKAASAPAPRSHKKGASGSKADGKTKLVGAAKASHERALARKAAEAAAAAGTAGLAAASDMQSMLEAGGSQPMPGLVARPQGAPPPALQQRAQQNGSGADNSSEGDAADLCASDSMSLGASVGAAGGMLIQSGLEAASGIGAHSSVLGMGADDAQDTLCSPRHRMNGGQGLGPAAGGAAAGAPPTWWPKPPPQQQQQQQQQAGRPAAAAPGRPPIPPSMRSGRGAPVGAAGAAKQAGGRQGAAPGPALDPQQAAGRQDDSGSPDLETTAMQMDVSGLSVSALDPSVAPPGLPFAGAAGLPPPLGSAQQQQQDALAAATNVPGTQDAAGAAAGAAAAALPPQLAGYYRWPGASLLGCLNRFTHAEQLGAGERWTCERCLSSAHAVKQLSLRHLPPLLVFHAKRFEHAGGLRAVAKKLDTYLSFPLSDLDMRPYLASAVLRSRFRLLPSPPAPALAAKARRASTGQLAPQQADRQQQQQQRSPASEGGLARGRSGAPPSGSAAAAADGSMDGGAEAANGVSPDPGQYLYDLYAVVCHRGSFQGGHYVAYVRAADRRWYLCDDAWVTASDEEAVRNCQAYMLFYSQKQLLEGR